MTKKEDLTNKIFTYLTVLNEVTDYISPSGNKKTRWLCKCNCGIIKEINSDQLKSGQTKSCGCLKKERAIKLNKKHGKSNTKEYICWLAMKDRCLNPNNSKHEYYKKTEIHKEWINSFETFLKDVGIAPTKNHSLDRIDNNGNYEPNNVRWATKQIQAINQNTPCTNTSGYKGVSYNKKDKKYVAYININKKHKELGRFKNLQEAIDTRKKAEEKYYKPLLDQK